MKKNKFFTSLFVVMLAANCTGPFPSESKIGVPGDHTDSKKGALHKGDKKHPFGKGGCNDSDCHQADLRGGVVIFEGTVTVTPSCYQCHKKNWKDGNGGNNND